MSRQSRQSRVRVSTKKPTLFKSRATPRPPVDVDHVLNRIQALSAYAEQQARGRDLVLVVGNTGAGKSTFVNYLAGRPMREVDNGDLELLIEADNPIMEIGHGGTSLTSEPQVYEDASTGLTYCDCPGFFDNRGPEFDITNAYAIKAMLECANSVKSVVVLVNFHSLEADRARGLRDTANILMQLLGIQSNDIAHFRDSILILVTRGQGEYSTQDIREFIATAGDTVIDTMISRINQYDPLDREEFIEEQGLYDRHRIIESLQQSPVIEDESGRLFGFALGSESLKALNELVNYMEATIREQFTERNYTAVNHMLDSLDKLRVLSSRDIAAAFNRTTEMIREQIRALEGDNANLDILQQIRQHITYFTQEAEASIKVVEDRIDAQRALAEAREREEEVQQASEENRDQAVAAANAAKEQAEEANEKHQHAVKNCTSVRQEATRKEKELESLRNRVVVREVHHHHHSGGGCGIM